MYDSDLDAHVCHYCDYTIRREQPVTFVDLDRPELRAVSSLDEPAWHVACAMIVNELELAGTNES
jgi:hypothetical protein